MKSIALLFLIISFGIDAKTLIEYEQAFELAHKNKHLSNYTLQYGSLSGNKIGLCDETTGTVTIDASAWKNETENNKQKIVNRELANCSIDEDKK